MSQAESEEDKVRRMAKVLISGATMLAEQCPNCGAPLFRLKDGTIRCFSCGFVEVREAKKEPEKKGILEKEVRRETLIKKLNFAYQILETSNDLEEIKEALEIIKMIYEIIHLKEE